MTDCSHLHSGMLPVSKPRGAFLISQLCMMWGFCVKGIKVGTAFGTSF